LQCPLDAARLDLAVQVLQHELVCLIHSMLCIQENVDAT
jgi:hypothetical protein